jgi:dihydrofolate reductase
MVSLDGFIEGPNGELDWVETWEDPFNILPQIDACILGRVMYPGYEQYWQAILTNPQRHFAFHGQACFERRDRIRTLRRENASYRAL